MIEVEEFAFKNTVGAPSQNCEHVGDYILQGTGKVFTTESITFLKKIENKIFIYLVAKVT